MGVTTNATSTPTKLTAATNAGSQVGESMQEKVFIRLAFNLKSNTRCSKMGDCSFTVILSSGVFRGKNPAVEGALGPPVWSKWATLQPQSAVWVRLAAGVHSELRAESHRPDCWRLEVGGQRELPEGPKNLRWYHFITAVHSAVCGGPPGGHQQPYEEVLQLRFKASIITHLRNHHEIPFISFTHHSCTVLISLFVSAAFVWNDTFNADSKNWY